MVVANEYRNQKIEFHILQSFPVTCLNRDDVGAPKSAMVGGVNRARVSSQCWKRAVRLAMHEVSGVELGIRTKLIADLVADECVKLGATQEQANSCGQKIQCAFIKTDDKKKDKKKDEEQDVEEKNSSDTLMFLAKEEIRKLAEKCKECDFEADKVIKQSDAKKAAKEVADIIGKTKLAQAAELDGLDIALFGRMVAQANSLDIPAASSFSHAISTHKVANEIEFFTAVADYGQDQGSAHMGSLEFNAATYYRYISLDLGQLYETLGGDRFFKEAITAFIKALYVAVPSARQTSQAGACSWDYAQVVVRKGQGIQMSCDEPVKAGKDGGFVNTSIEKLKDNLKKKEKLSGSLYGKIAGFEFGLDENYSIDNLIDEVVKAAVKA